MPWNTICSVRCEIELAAADSANPEDSEGHRTAGCLCIVISWSPSAITMYARTINTKGVIDIKNGRHPVVEKMINNDMFIANDTYLDNGSKRVSVITGPNMAGKSTYMRQTALIVLMAQIGSFVPAEKAKIGVVDRIFTRVGASDDLASGQSTFMVEMTEVANILTKCDCEKSADPG